AFIASEKYFAFHGRLMGLHDLQSAGLIEAFGAVRECSPHQKHLFPQEFTYFSSAGYTRKRMFKKAYAKTFVFTHIKTLMCQFPRLTPHVSNLSNHRRSR